MIFLKRILNDDNPSELSFEEIYNSCYKVCINKGECISKTTIYRGRDPVSLSFLRLNLRTSSLKQTLSYRLENSC